jgi:hypothetical protein
MKRTLAFLTAALIAAASPPVHAQPADIPALIKMIETQPADMDKSAWKEKRRESARKLVASKDKRAVPELIKLVETETFDIIGEIAIEGLGNFGDQSAVPALQKAANDASRDKATRDLAKKALAKLGANATVTMTPNGGGTTPPTGGGTTPPTGGGTTPPTGGGTTPPDGGGTTTPPDGGTTGSGLEGRDGAGTTGGGAAGGSSLFNAKPTEGVPEGPPLPDDTIAAYDRLTIAAGAASLSYDTVRERAAFDADVLARWQKRIERPSMAWGYDVGAHLVGGLVNPEGRATTRGAQIGIDGAAEARFYAGSKVYGIGKAAVGFQLNYVSYTDGEDPDDDVKDSRSTADLQAAIGGGYGRVVDVGAAIRVRRLARTLDAARALGKQIDDATSRKLQMAWWALRGERSSYRALVVTVAILREAGILLGEPDAGLSYELLAVLRDSQLFMRPEGLDIQLVVTEGYLVRDEMEPTPTEEGRIEQAILTASYGAQLAEDKAEVSGTAYARTRLLAPDAQPSPWAIGATGRLKRFAYGEHGDPLGALDVSATIALSKDGSPVGQPATQTALRLAGELGFTYWVNQASGVRAAATIAEDGGELFFGASIQATYGLLDGTYAH